MTGTGTLVALLPKCIKQDRSMVVICEALEPTMTSFCEALAKIERYTDIDTQSGIALDDIAWGWGAEWYNSQETLAARQQTVKDALRVHRHTGTASALKTAVSAAFGQAATEEWFEYGGEPYHFRILVEDPTATTSRAVEFLRIVEKIKNVRSELDAIYLLSTTPLPFFCGIACDTIKIIRSEMDG